MILGCTRTVNPDYSGFMGSLREGRDWALDKLGLLEDPKEITPEAYTQKEATQGKTGEASSGLLSSLNQDENSLKPKEGSQTPGNPSELKGKESIKEPGAQTGDNLLEERKDSSLIPGKTPGKDQVSQNPEKKLTDKLEYVLYAQDRSYMLLIKAGNFGSAALVTPKSLWTRKRQYFLRSRSPLQDKPVFLTYRGKRIGAERKLFFLSSSTRASHSLLGEAFLIRLPREAIYGYAAHKNLGRLAIRPGSTKLVIRKFQGKEGQGKYQDQELLLPALQNFLSIR